MVTIYARRIGGGEREEGEDDAHSQGKAGTE